MLLRLEDFALLFQEYVFVWKRDAKLHEGVLFQLVAHLHVWLTTNFTIYEA